MVQHEKPSGPSGGNGGPVAVKAKAPVSMTAEEAKRRVAELKAKMEEMQKRAKRTAASANLAGQNKQEQTQTEKRRKLDTPMEKTLHREAPATRSETRDTPKPQTTGGPRANPYLAHLREDVQPGSFGAYDARLGEASTFHQRKERRDRLAFKLLPKGKFIEAAEAERARQAHLAFLKDRKSTDTRRHFKKLLGTSTSSDGSKGNMLENTASKLAAFTGVRPVPTLEWWDKPFSTVERKAAKARKQAPENKPDKAHDATYNDMKIEYEKTFKLVQHPVPVAPLLPAPPPRQVPLYLTKEERKRQRRQIRQEREQEKRDKVLAGLIPPPEDKIKLSNGVLGNKIATDPTKVEAYAREKMAEREKNHQMRNLASKLTPQEKWEKANRKIEEDNAKGPHVAVYKVRDLTEPPELAASNRFKMDVNAQKLGLTGCVGIVAEPIQVEGLPPQYCNLVVVEGGPRGLAKFEVQMLRRIKFPPGPDGEPGSVKVWQGGIPLAF